MIYIWGINEIKTNKNGSLSLYDYCEKLIVEKNHINFCRYIMSCHKLTSKAAIKGDLGRFPLQLNIWIRAIKYLDHVKMLNVNSLAYKAYLEQAKLSKLNSNSWLFNF